jgi:hypothetical protein
VRQWGYEAIVFRANIAPSNIIKDVGYPSQDQSSKKIAKFEPILAQIVGEICDDVVEPDIANTQRVASGDEQELEVIDSYVFHINISCQSKSAIWMSDLLAVKGCCSAFPITFRIGDL